MTSSRSALLLFAGDTACLALFVLLGMRSHETLGAANGAQRFVQNALPLILAWGVAGLALGAFQWPRPRRSLLARTLNTWLVAAPLGLLLRALLQGSATVPVAFALVTLGLGGLLLLAWRALFAWGLAGRQPGTA